MRSTERISSWTVRCFWLLCTWSKQSWLGHGWSTDFPWSNKKSYLGRHHRIPSGVDRRYCPCTDHRFNGVVPPFIGKDYYCDCRVDRNPQANEFYTTPLWTGKGCTPTNFCCSHSRMPWFCKALPAATTDQMEICDLIYRNRSKSHIGSYEIIDFKDFNTL